MSPDSAMKNFAHETSHVTIFNLIDHVHEWHIGIARNYNDLLSLPDGVSQLADLGGYVSSSALRDVSSIWRENCDAAPALLKHWIFNVPLSSTPEFQ